jgi:hypothetical protein
MENLITNNNYKAAKEKAKEFYGTIGTIFCRALDSNIVFNRTGFDHLVQKERRMRPKSEQKRRFALLPFAKNILETHNGDITYKYRNYPQEKVGDTDTTHMHFWALTARQNEKLIKIVIRQLDGGEKHFFSIFEVNKKSTRKR